MYCLTYEIWLAWVDTYCFGIHRPTPPILSVLRPTATNMYFFPYTPQIDATTLDTIRLDTPITKQPIDVMGVSYPQPTKAPCFQGIGE